MVGKGYLHDVIFINCGHFNQNEIYVKTLFIHLKKENKELQYNDDVS